MFVTYPDGKSKQYTGVFGNPKIIDGSVLVIGKKKDEEPFDATEYFKELTSIIANFAQVVGIIFLARN